MQTPVLWVTASLTLATAIAATVLIASGARSDETSFASSAGPLKVETIATGLASPWALAFLPDGQMIVSEKSGQLRIISAQGALSKPVKGVPTVWNAGQGGLLDVQVDRAFAQNRTVYFCYSEKSGSGGLTAVGRARLSSAGDALSDVRTIFRQDGPLSSGNHYGCRIAQAADNNLFVTLGDHYRPRDEAQNLGNHIGKIIRITPDGDIPPDNPFVKTNGARPEIWSYGHRNQQGLTIHPETGQLWESEHGPRGGDEINVISKGKNYGWPVIGFGVDYSGAVIHQGTSKDGMEQPVKYWVPSIAPSGLAFYTGDKLPGWKGSLFSGALAGRLLVRMTVQGSSVTSEERILRNLNARIRDVRNGPDGALWLLTDGADGRVLRVTAADR